MTNKTIEYLSYNGELPEDFAAHQRYRSDVQRGKSLLQLKAIASNLTPEIRHSWSGRSFTPVSTPEGIYDEIVCNISYHFHKHGSDFGSIAVMTQEAKKYFNKNRSHAKDNGSGLLKFPNGSLFEHDGRIVTFFK